MTKVYEVPEDNVVVVEASPAGLPLSYLDTDITLTANSDVKVATQKATKGYVDARLPNGELKLTPKASSTGAEGTVFYCSNDNYVYVGVE